MSAGVFLVLFERKKEAARGGKDTVKTDRSGEKERERREKRRGISIRDVDSIGL